MIVSTSRAFFRTSKAWHSANSYVIGNRARQLQGYHGISYISKQAVPKGVFGSMGSNKKRKTVAPFWRQISTQSDSNQESLMVDVDAEPEHISSAEQGEQDNHIISIVRGVADSSISSSSLQAKNDVEGKGSISGSTNQIDGVKDAEDIFRDAVNTSAAQNIGGIVDEENLTGVSKKNHAKSVEVGAHVIRFIKGKDGSTQKSIEDIGVKLIFPSSKQEDSIVIEGSSEDVVTKASERIQAIIHEAANQPSLAYSHFISLPLAIHPELLDKVTKFQSTILGNDPTEVHETMDENSGADDSEKDTVDQSGKESGITVKLTTRDDTNHVEVDIKKKIPTVSYAPKAVKPPTLDDLRIDRSLFQKPQRLHLTILMLKLWNRERVRAATEILQGLSEEVNGVLDNRPVFVTLKGLDIMRGSRSKAQVLYARVEEIGNEGRLSRACQIITDAYVKAGLVLEKDARQKLRLHATLMNTSFRHGKRKVQRNDSFDARGIFQQFGSEIWGNYQIREAHLSQRFVYDDNGFYHCCASIPLHENSEVHESGASETELEKVPIADSA